jgi:integrase
LTAAEARMVLVAAEGTRNAARWTVALALGLRQSEALGLAWSAVDLDRGTLSVQRGLHRVKGHGLVSRSRSLNGMSAPCGCPGN